MEIPTLSTPHHTSFRTPTLSTSPQSSLRSLHSRRRSSETSTSSRTSSTCSSSSSSSPSPASPSDPTGVHRRSSLRERMIKLGRRLSGSSSPSGAASSLPTTPEIAAAVAVPSSPTSATKHGSRRLSAQFADMAKCSLAFVWPERQATVCKTVDCYGAMMARGPLLYTDEGSDSEPSVEESERESMDGLELRVSRRSSGSSHKRVRFEVNFDRFAEDLGWEIVRPGEVQEETREIRL